MPVLDRVFSVHSVCSVANGELFTPHSKVEELVEKTIITREAKPAYSGALSER